MTTPAVELSGITKRFPGVVANDAVNLRVAEGEIHAVVGENGAGKSTLMKILYGMQPADEGHMLVGGTEVSFGSPGDAIDHGIGMVHQHFMLADNLTVLENVVLGSENAALIVENSFWLSFTDSSFVFVKNGAQATNGQRPSGILRGANHTASGGGGGK